MFVQSNISIEREAETAPHRPAEQQHGRLPALLHGTQQWEPAAPVDQ